MKSSEERLSEVRKKGDERTAFYGLIEFNCTSFYFHSFIQPDESRLTGYEYSFGMSLDEQKRGN